MFKNETSQPVQNQGLLIAKGLLAAICFFAGAFGVFFFIWKQNYGASTSCLELEIACVLMLNLTSTVMKGTLHQKYTLTRIKVVFIVSVILAVLSFSGTLGYAALGAMNKQDFQLEQNGYYVAIIPSSLTCIWSTLLAFESRKHMATFPDPGGHVMGQFS